MIKQVKINIKVKIKERGTTTGAVCHLLKKDRGFINRMTDEVKLNKIVSIAHAIGCEPYELINGL